MAVGSAAELFAALRSPGVATVAPFVTAGNAALATDTVMLHSRLSPAAIGPACVAVTTPPAFANDQPAPAPLTNARPVGRVSLTLIVPVVPMLPTLCTASV